TRKQRWPSKPAHSWPCASDGCLLGWDSSSLHRARCRCGSCHGFEKKLRDQIHQNRHAEKHQPDLEQRPKIKVGSGFGELIGDYASKRVAGLKKRRCDLRRVADYHRDRHRFAKRAPETENNGAEQALLRVAQNRNPGHLPACRTQGVGGLTFQIWNAAQNLARDRSDDWQNHNGDDDSAGQHAGSVDRPSEKWRPTKELFQQWKRIVSQPWDHDKDPPQSEDDVWNRLQHFNQGNQRLANREWRKLRQINRSRDAQWDGDEERNQGRDQRSVNKRERAELLRYRVPRRCREEMEPEFLNGEQRSTPELPAGQNDQQNHPQRHRQGEPLERLVPKARGRCHRARYRSRIVGCDCWRYGNLHACWV